MNCYPPIGLLIRGAGRSNDGITRRVKPITNQLLRPLIKMLDPADVTHTIFTTMWAAALDGLLRHDDLAKLQIGDVQWSPRRAVLSIYDAKTGKGKYQYALSTTPTPSPATLCSSNCGNGLT